METCFNILCTSLLYVKNKDQFYDNDGIIITIGMMK